MLPAGFEPAIAASEWPQTHALDCTTTGIGENILILPAINILKKKFLSIKPVEFQQVTLPESFYISFMCTNFSFMQIFIKCVEEFLNV
jgi:hypothetical protein